jgi:hypothetical protein
MEALSNLPTWVQIVLALLAAVVLFALNAGWLLSTKATLDARKREMAKRSGQEPGDSKPGVNR